ncbi:MAG: 6-phosphogluconolactonase [Candidatus Woesearchaeota archaeon]
MAQKTITGDEMFTHMLAALKESISDVLKTKKQVNIGLPGGESANELFKLLKHDASFPWDYVHFFMVDERLVSITDPESNYRNAHAQFIGVVTEKEMLPEDNVHPFFIQEFKNQAKRNYEREIEEQGGVFDILIFGVGPDGHIASLFPNHPLLESEDPVTAFINDAPKAPPERITITPHMIAKASHAFLIFKGSAKQEAYEAYNDKTISVKDCPAKLVNSLKYVYVVTDLA